METMLATVQEEETVKQVLSRLEEGETRDVIAATMGYHTHKGLDQYMRRRHYTWDAIQGTYVPNRKHPNYESDLERYSDPGTRPKKVVEYLRHRNMRVKDVARIMRFADAQELARYMESCGYVWNEDIANYTKPRDPQTVVAPTPGFGQQAQQTPQNGLTPASGSMPVFASRWSVERYLPLLQLLDENQSRLTAILEGEKIRDEQQLPRYTVRGVRSVCSFYMVKGLHDMTKDFASERNVKQAEVVEAALIEFLQRHGYSEQVKCLLGAK